MSQTWSIHCATCTYCTSTPLSLEASSVSELNHILPFVPELLEFFGPLLRLSVQFKEPGQFRALFLLMIYEHKRRQRWELSATAMLNKGTGENARCETLHAFACVQLTTRFSGISLYVSSKILLNFGLGLFSAAFTARRMAARCSARRVSSASSDHQPRAERKLRIR